MMRIHINEQKWNEIEKKHWEYVSKNINLGLIGDHDKLKSFLNENLEVIIKGKKSEWDEKVIPEYEELIQNELKNYKIRLVHNFMHCKKQKLETIIEDLKQLETEESANNANYVDFEKVLSEWMNANQKQSIKSEDKQEFLKQNYKQEYEVYEINNKINKIFDYDKFTKGDSKIGWGRHELLVMLGIEACPYCNRNYITYYEEENKKKTTADLDHYYPKSKYPFLALSLYNFIPSCKICNSLFKRDNNVQSLYPYEEGF